MSTNDCQTLRSCPFCGGEAEVHPSNDWDTRFTGATFFVWCDGCETRGDYYCTESEAIEAWNTRAYTLANTDAEVFANAARGLFADLMSVDKTLATTWAKAWPELFEGDDE